MSPRAVAFLPCPPGLVPEISRGAAGELDGVRAACAAALDRVLSEGPVVVLGPAETSGSVGSARGFGVDLEWSIGPGTRRLPWPQAAGAWLLAQRGVRASASGPAVPDADVCVLAMGDGSICRSDRAPGAFDPRAEGWDSSVATGLAAGSLDGVDWELGRELQAVGVPIWEAVAAAGGEWDAVLHAHEAPQGVGLLVASWLRR